MHSKLRMAIKFRFGLHPHGSRSESGCKCIQKFEYPDSVKFYFKLNIKLKYTHTLNSKKSKLTP